MKFYKLLLIFLYGILFHANCVQAQECDTTINVSKAGTLRSQLSAHSNISSLKIIGSININDIAFIREIAGCINRVNGDPIKKTGSLKELNLENAKFVGKNDSIPICVYNDKKFYDFYARISDNGKENSYLFAGLSTLKSVYLPNNITQIGERTFYNCDSLRTVIIPNDVRKIDACAFAFCSNLSNIKIPSSLTYIGRCAFERCNLTSLNFSEKLKTIDEYAFYRCTQLTKVTFPSSLERIGNSAFYLCSNLTEVVFKTSNIANINFDYYVFDFCNLPKAPFTLKNIKTTQKTVSFNLDIEGNETMYLIQGDQIKKLSKGYHSFNIPFRGGVSLDGFVVINNKLYESYNTSIKGNGYSPTMKLERHPFVCRFKGSYTLEDGVDKPSYEKFAWGYNTRVGYQKRKKVVGEKSGNEIAINENSINVVLESSKEEFDGFWVSYWVDGENTTTTFEFPKLILTTIKEAKATSNTSAIICAKTNIDELADYVGFEWRRYDAPDLVPSSRAYCPIIDGTMIGTLKNLNTNTYYKFRPFCVAPNGTEYFGDWSAFGTADAYVQFDPIVRTYNISNIEDFKATIKGNAIAGSDAIIEQGFEYWETAEGKDTSAMMNILSINNKKIIKAEGQWMTATLENLKSGQTYAIRAFARTAKGTTYAETKTFTTTTLTNIGQIFTSENSLAIKVVGQSQSNLTVNVSGMKGLGHYQLFKLNGTMICNGVFNTTDRIQNINIPHMESGIYILKISDDKQSKAIRVLRP